MGYIMIITCEECNTSFNLDENLLRPTGSKVRCSKCNKVFVAYPTKPIETPEQEEISKTEEEAPKEEDVPEEAVEDLDLDLDFEPEADQAVEEVEAEAKEESDELDLSDLEDFLDEEETPKEEDVPEEAVEDLDLDLDFELEPDQAVEEIEAEAKFEENGEIDLKEIEAMLDEEDQDIESEDEPVDVDLELDMKTELELEKTLGDVEVEDEPEDMEDVDLSDIEKMLEEEADAEIETDLEEVELDGIDEIDAIADTEEVGELDEIEDIELGLEEEIAEVQETEDEKEEADDKFYIETRVLEEAVEESPEAYLETEDEIEDQEKPVVKKGISKPILVLLIITLLGGAGYGGYTLIKSKNIEIPFISDYLKPKVQDPVGNLKIDTSDISSKFVENTKEGKLFVVTGKVKNNYKGDRSFISVAGKLFRKGKKPVLPGETVFCGNVLSDIELSKKDLKYMKDKLSNKNGENNSNVGVKSGQILPFMLIFTNLPDDIEEFAIEVAGSTAK